MGRRSRRPGLPTTSVAVSYEHSFAAEAIGEIPACQEEAGAEAVAIRIVHAADGVARREESLHSSDGERALAEKVLFVLSRIGLEGGADFRHAARIDAPHTLRARLVSGHDSEQPAGATTIVRSLARPRAAGVCSWRPQTGSRADDAENDTATARRRRSGRAPAALLMPWPRATAPMSSSPSGPRHLSTAPWRARPQTGRY